MGGAELESPRIQSVLELPTELIIKIIGIVEGGHHLKRGHPRVPSPLAASALVSRTWNTLCRLRMFHTVSVYANNVYPRLSFLHFQAPHISQYIRELYFAADAADGILAEAEWFPECFARLKNLRTLGISYGEAPLPVGALATFAAPQLRKLVILNWQFTSVCDLLCMFPPTLEELCLEEITFDPSHTNVDVGADLDVKAPGIPGVRLEALQNLEFPSGFPPMFVIECPNLKRLSFDCLEEPLHLPPWIPDSLPELVLSAIPDSAIPDFGTAIRPSLVTITMHRGVNSTYLDHFTWARNCINRLPYPRSIQALTISIKIGCHGQLYPELSDYATLSEFLCQLRSGGQGNCLTSIVLVIKMITSSTAVDKPHGDDEARELAKLEKGFSGLVEENVLDVDFTLVLSPVSEPLVYCSIRRV